MFESSDAQVIQQMIKDKFSYQYPLLLALIHSPLLWQSPSNSQIEFSLQIRAYVYCKIRMLFQLPGKLNSNNLKKFDISGIVIMSCIVFLPRHCFSSINTVESMELTQMSRKTGS